MGAFPTIEDYCIRLRTYVGDTFAGTTGTPGEGRVLTDSHPSILPLLNESIWQLQRDLENTGFMANRQEVVIYNIPVISGANGPGNPDPAAQQALSFSGFFDGTNTTVTPTLPTNLITPLYMWQRNSNSNLPFGHFKETTTGIRSDYQSQFLGEWEWRNNTIYWNGSTQLCDIRLRYSCTSIVYTSAIWQPSTFPLTALPFLEDVQPLAAWAAYKYTKGKPGMLDVDSFKEDYQQAMLGMANRIVRAKQAAPVVRESYGDEAGIMEWGV